MRRLVCMFLIMTGLSACVSVLPEEESADALYSFSPITIIADLQLNHSVLVREPEAPFIFSGRNIVTRDDANAIRYVKGVEWADRVPKLFQYSLLDSFNAENTGFAILPETGSRADYEVSWRIVEFTLKDTQAVAHMEVTLLDGSNRKAVRQTLLQASIPVTERGAEARIDALVQAAQDIIEQAALFISTSLGQLEAS